MLERKVIVTYEAINDIVDAEEYIRYSFGPAIIFWVIINEEVHILRVPREEYNWQKFFKENQYSEYSYPENSTVN
ncbi:MAG: hypothetical protein IKU06_00475 [Lachnospiraceae bacterium]|nr:hypothetical protein [Lachnospiraceae bacterium]